MRDVRHPAFERRVDQIEKCEGNGESSIWVYSPMVTR